LKAIRNLDERHPQHEAQDNAVATNKWRYTISILTNEILNIAAYQRRQVVNDEKVRIIAEL
jgi:hypothetical protein